MWGGVCSLCPNSPEGRGGEGGLLLHLCPGGCGGAPVPAETTSAGGQSGGGGGWQGGLAQPDPLWAVPPPAEGRWVGGCRGRSTRPPVKRLPLPLPPPQAVQAGGQGRQGPEEGGARQEVTGPGGPCGALQLWPPAARGFPVGWAQLPRGRAIPGGLCGLGSSPEGMNLFPSGLPAAGRPLPGRGGLGGARFIREAWGSAGLLGAAWDSCLPLCSCSWGGCGGGGALGGSTRELPAL